MILQTLGIIIVVNMMKYVHKYLEMNCEMVFHIKMIQSRNLRVALFVISLNPLHAKFFRGNKNVYSGTPLERPGMSH